MNPDPGPVYSFGMGLIMIMIIFYYFGYSHGRHTGAREVFLRVNNILDKLAKEIISLSRIRRSKK